MTKPRVLDLFCGAGGAAAGYSRAGFDVVGVDINPQPRFPFTFIQADALTLPVEFIRTFHFVHASPPCQAHTAMKTMPSAKAHPDLIPATRAMLKASGKPYVIENVEGAPLLSTVTLCGCMFNLGAQGCRLQRRRQFECSFPVEQPKCSHSGREPDIGIYGGHARRRAESAGGRTTRDVWIGGHKAAASEAMGIDWMTMAEISEAIPPAYSHFVARAWLATQKAAA